MVYFAQQGFINMSRRRAHARGGRSADQICDTAADKLCDNAADNAADNASMVTRPTTPCHPQAQRISIVYFAHKGFINISRRQGGGYKICDMVMSDYPQGLIK